MSTFTQALTTQEAMAAIAELNKQQTIVDDILQAIPREGFSAIREVMTFDDMPPELQREIKSVLYTFFTNERKRLVEEGKKIMQAHDAAA